MKKIIHKSVRPKYNYTDPTLCASFLYRWKQERFSWFKVFKQSKLAHFNSRTTWKNVNCKLCLKKRK